MSGQSLFDKVWDQHIVVPESDDFPAVFYIDLHLIHEVTTPQAFSLLRELGIKVRRPDLVLATLDHSTPTVPIATLADLDVVSEPPQANQIRAMIDNCKAFGIELHGFDSDQRGIVHVIGPEIGATQPGKTIVCGDSHSATHGAFRLHRVRHRQYRGRARAGYADAAATQAEEHGDQCRGRAAAGRDGQGHHPLDHR